MNDDELLAEVKEAIDATDPPPAGLAAMAVRALTWDTESESLAERTYDSKGQMAGMRSDTAVRDLTFEGSGLSIELSLSAEGDHVLVEGLVDGLEPDWSVRLHQPGRDPVTLQLDDAGRFDIETSGALADLSVQSNDRVVLRTGLFSLHPEP